jgi:hypothetical protein
MKLGQYLDDNEISFREFGEKIGLSAEGVRLIALGQRFPRRNTLAEIVRETGGEVGIADFSLADPNAPPTPKARAKRRA